MFLRLLFWYNYTTQTDEMHNLSKLIYNFWRLQYVTNLVGSSSGKQLYMQYGTFYMHRWCICCVYNFLPEDEPAMFETCTRQKQLNINLENCAFRWFMKIIRFSFGNLHGKPGGTYRRPREELRVITFNEWNVS
jgi:hypothetical protein